jgi:hypothetical protein
MIAYRILVRNLLGKANLEEREGDKRITSKL